MDRELARALAAALAGDEARELELAALQPDRNGLNLVSLFATHLLAFAGTKQSLLDAPVRQAWNSLKPAQRWHIKRTGLESFRNTGMLSWDPDESDRHRKLVLHPHAALVMGARINPRFVLTAGLQRATRGVRVFAIESGNDSADCFIVENPDASVVEADETGGHPFAWYYRYWLGSRRALSGYLARYAAAPVERGSSFAAQPRVMSLYRPPVTDKSMVASLEVHGAGKTAKVVRRGPGASGDGDPVDMAVEELATIVSEMLAA